MTSLAHFSVNSRSYSYVESLSHELNFEEKKNYLFDLSYLGLINIEGARALDFLQGQFTCDIRDINRSTMRPGALCNLQGRILTIADILQCNIADYSLILPHDNIAKTISSLEKVAMLSRVKLNPFTEFQVLGLYLQNPLDILPSNIDIPGEPFAVTHREQHCCYAIADKLYVILLPKNHDQTLEKPFIEHQQWRGSLAWHLLKLKQKQIEIYPESRGLFLPHRLGLQLNPTISFNKGCYKGQEIIARTHYRAKLKHALKEFIIDTPSTLRSGLAVYANEGRNEIGEIIDYCPITETTALVSISIIFDYPQTIYLQENNLAYKLSDE